MFENGSENGSKIDPMERIKAWEQEMMRKHGWYAQFVFSDPESPTGSNVHTHGLEETWGHPDLQIVLPIRAEISNDLFFTATKMIAKGTTFQPGKKYSRIIKGYKVMFAWANESGRRVLRMIIPDPEGRLEKSEMTGPYAAQWEGTEEFL